MKLISLIQVCTAMSSCELPSVTVPELPLIASPAGENNRAWMNPFGFVPQNCAAFDLSPPTLKSSLLVGGPVFSPFFFSAWSWIVGADAC